MSESQHFDMERNGGGSLPQKIETEDQLRTVLTNASISPELFEKLYLSPKNDVSGDLRKTFANPTPMAVMGFSVAVLPIACELMGWRNSGGFSAATIPCSVFFGGMLLIIAGIMEWVLGNNFPFLVFMGYGSHFLSFVCTFLPSWDAIGFYSKGDNYKVTPKFAASFGYYPISLGILSFIFLLGSFRTNAIFVCIFICATTAFGFATASLFYTATGNAALADKYLVATGAGFFGADIFGWYLFLGMMIATMELPLPDPPVFDLSTVIKPKKAKVQ